MRYHLGVLRKILPRPSGDFDDLSTAEQGKNVWSAVSCSAIILLGWGSNDYVKRFLNQRGVHLSLNESHIFYHTGPFNKPAMETFH